MNHQSRAIPAEGLSTHDAVLSPRDRVAKWCTVLLPLCLIGATMLAAPARAATLDGVTLSARLEKRPVIDGLTGEEITSLETYVLVINRTGTDLPMAGLNMTITANGPLFQVRPFNGLSTPFVGGNEMFYYPPASIDPTNFQFNPGSYAHLRNLVPDLAGRAPHPTWDSKWLVRESQILAIPGATRETANSLVGQFALLGAGVGVTHDWEVARFVRPTDGEVGVNSWDTLTISGTMGEQFGSIGFTGGAEGVFHKAYSIIVFDPGPSPCLSCVEPPPGMPTQNLGTEDYPIWSFENVSGEGKWFDPVMASGYEYSVTDGISNFTHVGLPSLSMVPDTDGMYTVVSTNGTAQVQAGRLYVFDPPVDFFTILGINPTVNGSDPLAFPTFLQFDQLVVSFTQTPIPLPVAGWASLFLLGILGGARHFNRIMRRHGGKLPACTVGVVLVASSVRASTLEGVRFSVRLEKRPVIDGLTGLEIPSLQQYIVIINRFGTDLKMAGLDMTITANGPLFQVRPFNGLSTPFLGGNEMFYYPPTSIDPTNFQFNSGSYAHLPGMVSDLAGRAPHPTWDSKWLFHESEILGLPGASRETANSLIGQFSLFGAGVGVTHDWEIARFVRPTNGEIGVNSWDRLTITGTNGSDTAFIGLIGGAEMEVPENYEFIVYDPPHWPCLSCPDPILPISNLGSDDNPIWFFENVPGEGRWFDPPMTSGYEYAITDGLSKFTLVRLPSLAVVPDADNRYIVVSSNGIVDVEPGSFHQFDPPVDFFTILDINPTINGSDPFAFPTFLQFDQLVVSFTQTPIPSPVATWGLGLMLAVCAGRRRRTGQGGSIVRPQRL